ncbi:hypothetical protein [Noviherbaspirillum galbum]|uniref:Uncharacterized protein n=1 Tax=Noviherbaspirillum galbum TaxID=2709383 RepID=A0A6B3SV38_9BURK|nr:hypothetical protein [Noviherbaspirillum galbum]NEX64587.1 hypothetical protein [Noviherbaspirillum galbum]
MRITAADGSLLDIMQAGAAYMGGTATAATEAIASSLGTVTTSAIAGAAGSVASQVVGNAIGAQDGFSLQSVALGAIGAGVSAGMEGLASNAVVRAAAGNAVSQGIGMVTGLRSEFSWTSVVASAIGAGVGGMAQQGMEGAFKGSTWDPLMQRMATGAASGMASGIAESRVQNGRVSGTQAMIDAFRGGMQEGLREAGNATSTDMSQQERLLMGYRLKEIVNTDGGDAWLSTSRADFSVEGRAPKYSHDEYAQDLAREKSLFSRQEPLANFDDGMSLIYARRENRTVGSSAVEAMALSDRVNGGMVDFSGLDEMVHLVDMHNQGIIAKASESGISLRPTVENSDRLGLYDWSSSGQGHYEQGEAPDELGNNGGGRTESLWVSDYPMPYSKQMNHVSEVAKGFIPGLINGVPKTVMSVTSTIWEGAQMQGLIEAGVDPSDAYQIAKQSTQYWSDGEVIPYANNEQRLGGFAGKIYSPFVYTKGAQLASFAARVVPELFRSVPNEFGQFPIADAPSAGVNWRTITGNASSRAEGIVTAYRVEGISNQRLVINEAGEVSLIPNKGQIIWINFGQEGRAMQYLQTKIDKGLVGAELKSFEVDVEFLETVRSKAVPEKFSRLNPDNPIISRDPYPDQYGIPNTTAVSMRNE